jgi:hypothetical protein
MSGAVCVRGNTRTCTSNFVQWRTRSAPPLPFCQLLETDAVMWQLRVNVLLIKSILNLSIGWVKGLENALPTESH